MKLSQKDIKEIIKVTKDGEVAPIFYKNGKLYVPTSKGFQIKRRKGGK